MKHGHIFHAVFSVLQESVQEMCLCYLMEKMYEMKLLFYNLLLPIYFKLLPISYRI